MGNYTIFGIHINNVKEDYANAFRFVKYGKDIFTTMEEQNWIKKHIFFKTKENNISSNENIYKNIIKEYEQWYFKQNSQIDLDWDLIPSLNDSFFYFRVKSSDDDDIINLHNFFLGSKICPERCCLGIIADEKGMHFKISDYLFFEVYFAKGSNNIKIIRKNSKNTEENKYQLELINNKPVNVFLLNRNSQGLFPVSLHKKGVNYSGTFFPQMKINRNLYFKLSENANNFCQKITNYKIDEKYEQYSNDLLLNIVLLNNTALPIQTQEIEKILNKPFTLKNENIIESILLLYCTRCIKYITGDKSSDNCNNLFTSINQFLNTEADNSTILAICFFLSYLSRIKRDDITSTKWIDILTDSQDYASGTLQLIENVIKHVPGEEGVFCFRLHKCLDNGDKSANARLIKRYSIIDEKSSGFYIEILVSDFNEEFDIPQKFIGNIEKNLKMPEDEREYFVSESLLESISKFRLKDLFDYHNSQNTEQVWENFYSQPQNLIAHYGLLVFEHLVKFAHGSFHVFSSNKFTVNENQYYESEKDNNKTYIHIPGTQYEILLPIGVSQTPLETGLVQEAKYNGKIKNSQIVPIGEENYKLLLNEQFKSFYKSSNRSRTPYWKSKTAIEISENIIKAICEKIQDYSFEEPLFTFNVENITNMTSSEVFVKALIRVIFSKKTLEAKRFAFIKASEVFLTTFTRFFSIIYMKSRQSSQMEGRLIYLCSSSMSDEVYFSGSSIKNSFAITKRAVLDETGKATHGLQILRREAEKSGEPNLKEMDSYQNIQQIMRPFFKQRALIALNSDIQHEGFGCCMHETHMRIGSKIHINGNYYEASLLFGFSGYVSNFAMYVAENIAKLINETQTLNDKKMVIIGYETYSENLAICIKTNLQKLFNKKRIKVDYVIYNESLTENKFYRWSLVKPDKDTKFVVVVPIGSTLTTHDKVVADLLRTDFEGTNHEKPQIDSIVAHYVLVLVRDRMRNKKRNKKTDMSDTEKIFWKEIIETSASDSNKDIIIVYKKEMSNIGADNKINCYLDAETNWYLPNECPFCFPNQNNLVAEKPLILSNRSSVVPMTKIGKSEKFDGLESKNIIDLLGTSITDDIDNMRPLYDALCYGHVIRDGDNHFEYYFQTEKIMEYLMEKDSEILKNKLNVWSNGLKSQRSSDIIYYDYVVAPIHNTNANFVNYVSQNLHTKQIIWIDTKKDFRDNIITKYSNLNSLYQNCCKQKEKIEICFHYVDDTINSGDSFIRAKSLISSIFTEIESENENVKINVFHSIFLLLNRCSFNTKKNFVDNPEQNFHSVFDLNISYMRSYSDACVPCKNESNLSEVIPLCSATSNVAVLSLKKSRRFQKREAEKISDSSYMIPIGDIENNASDIADIDKLRSRYYYRMIITHRLNNVLKKLNKSMNNKHTVEKYIWLQIDEILLIEDTSQQIDLLISLLKVISRPFLSFRKSVNESAMKIIIAISEYVILNKKTHISNSCTLEQFDELLENPRNRILFVKVLFSCLARLRSTFLLRSCTLKEILKMCNNENFKCPENFIELYIFYIKSMLCLSEKNSLSFWIENMVSENKLCEFSGNGNDWLKDSEEVDLKEYTYGKTVRNMLKIENIIPIRDALIQCYKQWERKKFDVDKQIEVIKETLGHYYCRSYCEFSRIDKKNNENQFDYHCQFVFSPMLSLYHHLSQSGDTLRNGIKETEYYTRLLNLVKEILEAEIAELFTRIPPNSTEYSLKNGGVFLLFSTENIQQNASQKTNLIEFVEKITESDDTSSFTSIGGTLYLEKSENSNRIGAIKIINTSSTDVKSQDFVYFIVFKWNTNLNDMEIISKVRNLLSMRSMLMKRIVKDFDNHIRNEFIMLRDKVKYLSIDRSGSHSPFEELKSFFFATHKKIKSDKSNGEMNELYMGCLKLIADSVISKWYVHSIAKTFPEKFYPDTFVEKYSNCYNDIPIIQYQKMFEMLKSNGKLVTDSGATKIASVSSSFAIDWENCEFFSPNNCGYIWCCAFIALYYNALNHGYAEKNKDGKEEVIVEVVQKDNFIIFKNQTKSGKEISEHNSTQVTLEALKYYFDNYYGKSLFDYETKEINEKEYFEIRIPLKHIFSQEDINA